MDYSRMNNQYFGLSINHPNSNCLLNERYFLFRQIVPIFEMLETQGLSLKIQQYHDQEICADGCVRLPNLFFCFKMLKLQFVYLKWFWLNNYTSINLILLFFVDEEQKIYYIDFETINVNLNDIAVKNAAGKVVFQDEVFNLPVNTIYELDMHTFPKGKYVVELRSYTGVLRREFFVP